MKTKVSLILLGSLLLFSQAAMAITNAVSYTVSAQVPLGSGSTVTATQVLGTGGISGDYSTLTGNSFVYLPLQFSSVNKVYLGQNYFIFDVATVGAGSMSSTVTWADTAQPAGAINKLGTNSAISFDKEVFTSSSTNPTQSVISGPFVLSNATSTTISQVQSGGWFRIIMGLCTGAKVTNSAGPADPNGCNPFTGSDAVGGYTGTLGITTTVT